MFTSRFQLRVRRGCLVLLFAAQFGFAAQAVDSTGPSQPAQTDPSSNSQPTVGGGQPAAAQPQSNLSPATNTTSDGTDAGESWLTGSVDAGYRWRTGVDGDYNVYRSIVDLGRGPKLLDTEFSLIEPSKRFFDRIDVRAYDYGDEPSTMLHVSARKANTYDFEYDHRNIAYFNNLPSFANQYIGQGLYNSEEAFDIRKELNSFQLDLFPNHFLVPYFGYDQNADNGGGITGFDAAQSMFTVPDLIRDSMNNYRAGVRLNAKLWHATIEMGGTTFKDDEQVYTSRGSGPNYGNEARTAGGLPAYLGTLNEAYGVRNDSLYSRGTLNASLTDWLEFYGQFLFSRPREDVNLSQYATGNLYATSAAVAYTAYDSFIESIANLPHTSASVGAEIFPHKRFRMSVNWLTDLQETSGAATLAAYYYRALGYTVSPSAYNTDLRNNYSEFNLNAFYDVNSKLTLRAGYRDVVGDTMFYFSPADGYFPTGSGTLRQNIGVGGVMFHPTTKLRINAVVEAAPGTSTYFRDGLYQYQKANAQVHYQITGSLNAGLDYNVLNNKYPVPGVNYGMRSQQASASLYWTPKSAKRLSIVGEYTKSLFRSNIYYLNPVNSAPIQSVYSDNANVLTALVDMTIGRSATNPARLSFGGSLLQDYGSRPTEYYQPLAKLIVPINKHVAWVSDWTYYGYNEAFFAYEAFHTHLIVTGIRLSR